MERIEAVATWPVLTCLPLGRKARWLRSGISSYELVLSREFRRGRVVCGACIFVKNDPNLPLVLSSSNEGFSSFFHFRSPGKIFHSLPSPKLFQFFCFKINRKRAVDQMGKGEIIRQYCTWLLSFFLTFCQSGKC